MNIWGWDNAHGFGHQVVCSNAETTSSGIDKRTGEAFSRCGSDDIRAMIVPLSWRKYKPGDFPAIGPLNLDLIINKDANDEN